jgi:hypothetical protein
MTQGCPGDVVEKPRDGAGLIKHEVMAAIDG